MGGAAARPRASARPDAALRALRPVTRGPRGESARPRPRTDEAAGSRGAADAVREDRAGASADRRRRGAPAGLAGPAPKRRDGPDRPAPAAFEQLVDAQPGAAREGE